MRSVGKTSEAEDTIERAQSEARDDWLNKVQDARDQGLLADWEINHCLSPDNIKRWWPLAPAGRDA